MLEYFINLAPELDPQSPTTQKNLPIPFFHISQLPLAGQPTYRPKKKKSKKTKHKQTQNKENYHELPYLSISHL